jgi:hypothetical protein
MPKRLRREAIKKGKGFSRLCKRHPLWESHLGNYSVQKTFEFQLSFDFGKAGWQLWAALLLALF